VSDELSDKKLQSAALIDVHCTWTGRVTVAAIYTTFGFDRRRSLPRQEVENTIFFQRALPAKPPHRLPYECALIVIAPINKPIVQHHKSLRYEVRNKKKIKRRAVLPTGRGKIYNSTYALSEWFNGSIVFVFFSFSAVIIPFKDRLNGVRFLVFKGEKWRFLPRSPRSFLGFFSTGVPPPWCGMDAPAALINSATISEMDVEEFLQSEWTFQWFWPGLVDLWFVFNKF
jgi:hypothetical protein